MSAPYKPRLNKKKCGKTRFCLTVPEKNVVGVFNGLSVEVNLNEAGDHLLDCGLGTLSKNGKVVFLNLEEAFFLAYILSLLSIKIDTKEEPLQWEQFLEHAKNINTAFIERLAAYVYLKSMGWIVKSGLKFGGHFVIYKHGPRYFHASFSVLILSNGMHRRSQDVTGVMRVAETANKDVLVLEVTIPAYFQFNAVSDIKLITVAETVLRRFTQKTKNK